MTKVFSFKKAIAIGIVACICAAVVCVPAYAYYYSHDAEHMEAQSTGVIEVVCTLDQTAVGGGVNTQIVFVSEDATAADALDEAVIGSNAANDPSAIKNHSAVSFREYIANMSYSVNVYEAASQKPGTQTSYDSTSLGGETTALKRYDSVVVVVE